MSGKVSQVIFGVVKFYFTFSLLFCGDEAITTLISVAPKTLVSSLEPCIAKYSLDFKLFHARRSK